MLLDTLSEKARMEVIALCSKLCEYSVCLFASCNLLEYRIFFIFFAVVCSCSTPNMFHFKENISCANNENVTFTNTSFANYVLLFSTCNVKYICASNELSYDDIS